MPEKSGEIKAYSQEEVKDMILGPVGTELRDKYEKELAEELKALENVEI